MSDLLLNIWDKELIIKIAFKVGMPKFIDEWTANLTHMRFAHVCVTFDLTKPLCLGTKIQIKDEVIWQ